MCRQRTTPMLDDFSGSLALNKLNLQFLTLYDYLLRNFNLFALESTCKFPDGCSNDT